MAELATLILEIARGLPGKRNRWLKLAQRHRPLFDQTVALLGVQFFQDLMAGYGDFESPLWRILEQNRICPAWTVPALAIAAAAVLSGTAAWNGKTI